MKTQSPIASSYHLQVRSTQDKGSPIFLLFRTWSSYNIISSRLGKVKVFSNLALQFQLTFNVCMETIYDVYLLVPHCFIKMFHLQQKQSILDSLCCNNSCHAYPGKVKAIAVYLKKVSFLLNYMLPTHKKKLTTRKVMIT